jgi:hypothetical protein
MAVSKETNRTKNKKIKALILATVLIIVLVIILILYESNQTFSSLPSGGLTGCIANSNYICQNQIYNHSTGNIFVTLGQNTGTRWLSANFIFVPQYQPTNKGYMPITINSTAFTTDLSDISYSNIGLSSGQSIHIVLPVNRLNGNKVPVGTYATGAIWVEYTTMNNSTPQYVQIATINIQAS